VQLPHRVAIVDRCGRDPEDCLGLKYSERCGVMVERVPDKPIL
jgi:hypothetical protein